MIKSPVEGSTAALVRLETPVVYSDFIRPICLPDELSVNNNSAQKTNSQAEKSNSDNTLTRTKKDENSEMLIKENRDFFIGPIDLTANTDEDLVRKARAVPEDLSIMPIHVNAMNETLEQPQTNQSQSIPNESTPPHTQWSTCNTLGWSRQRDHLQRVQLKMSHMASCENISIATVNSMCTEAEFHKQDCTEEEYAGSPVMCILPDSHQWALVGIASWRIACAPTGIERPRMYDKITPNSAWIRNTINAT